MASDIAEGLGIGSGDAPKFSTNAADYENDAVIEQQWAVKCMHHAETYFKLLSARDPKLLRLTRIDDEIFDEFLIRFSNMQIDVLRKDDLKSAEAKEIWRPFCNKFEGRIEDFNFGTLLRLDASKDYTEENSILVTRIQFYAVEIARNRRGLNSCHFVKASDS